MQVLGPYPRTRCGRVVCAGDSKYLLTAAGDQSVKLWNIVTGELLFTWTMTGCVRGLALPWTRVHLAVARPSVLTCRCQRPLPRSRALGCVELCVDCDCACDDGSAARSVAWAEGERQFVVATDRFMDTPAGVHVFDFPGVDALLAGAWRHAIPSVVMAPCSAGAVDS